MSVSISRLLAAATCGALCAGPALAQDAKPLRWTLEEAVNAPDWLSLSGSIRPRYETLGNQFVAGRTGDDEFFGVQSLLKAEIDTGDIILGGELLDSRRISGDAGGGTPAEIDALEPTQFYFAWRPKDFLITGARLDLTLGRFTMDIGSRRLVGRSNYRSIVTEFDGVRGVWTGPNKIQITGFYSGIGVRAPSDVPSALDNEVVFNPTGENVRFGGVHVQGPLPLNTIGEVYVFDLDEDDASETQTRNRDFASVGVRLKRAPNANRIDADLEYVRQTGTIRASNSPADIIDLDHDASLLHLEAGYTFDAAWVPRVVVLYDLASGDKSSTDLSNQRFDSLSGDRTFEFGPTSIYGAVARTNLDSIGLRLEVKPDKSSEFHIAVLQVKLDEARDSFANSNVRDATAASGKDVGAQIETRYRRWLIRDSVRLSIGGAALFRGDFLKMAPNATLEGDTYYGFTELTFSL